MASPLTQTDPRTVRSTVSKTVKDGELAAEAAPIIKEKTASLLAATDDDDSDPFDSDIEEDDDELADNEVAVDDT